MPINLQAGILEIVDNTNKSFNAGIATQLKNQPHATPEMGSMVVVPNITVRFANPQYNCETEEYCVDVEFQSDLEDQELFGMNVRFLYDDQILELIDFRDFQGGYDVVQPDPPQFFTSPPGIGWNLFHFGAPSTGVAELINGAIQLVDENQTPIYISTTGWTKIFQICFQIDDNDPDSTNFCPPIVWDLEQNTANGGFFTGSDGVVIVVVDEENGGNGPVFEYVDHLNWDYIGSGPPPYGEPEETDCIPLIVDASINASTSPLCYYTDRTFQPAAPFLPGATYEWDFGDSAVPATATGYGPHDVYYTLSGSKTVELIIYPNGGEEQCADSAEIVFNVFNCPGHIIGFVKTDTEEPIEDVNIRLYADMDTNGVADNNTAIRSVFTTETGQYSMAAVSPGNYVVAQIQPVNWFSRDDFDSSDDEDIVDNIDSLDNLIPVSLLPSEMDSMNIFIEMPAPGIASGNVFIDWNANEIPDSDEGMGGVIIEIFADEDLDGIADSGTPMFIQETDSSGGYSIEGIPIGNYVIAESQPPGYLSIEDIDASNDLDSVPNTDLQNDTIPLTIGLGEHDDNNYFMEAEGCALMVTNTDDSGFGSLREAIECSEAGDTITFHSILAGLTINIITEKLILNKNLYIHSSLEPKIIISSQVQGLFEVTSNVTVEFKDLEIVSGLIIDNNAGAAFKNLGSLKLVNVKVYKNENLPSGQYLIRNNPSSLLSLDGNCFIEME